MPKAFVALGANLGNPPQQLADACQQMAALPGTTLLGCSRYYRSVPIGPAGQPDYCNAVAAIETELAPEPLLAALQAIETAAGRSRGERWAARTLDLDLLLHGDTVMNTVQLRLPHPEMHRRNFVLLPLAELAPELIIPGHGSLSSLLAQLSPAGLERWA